MSTVKSGALRLGDGCGDHAGSKVDSRDAAARSDRMSQRKQRGAASAANVEGAFPFLRFKLRDETFGNRLEELDANVVIRVGRSIKDASHDLANI
jgi:hypothetical protein